MSDWQELRETFCRQRDEIESLKKQRKYLVEKVLKLNAALKEHLYEYAEHIQECDELLKTEFRKGNYR